MTKPARTAGHQGCTGRLRRLLACVVLVAASGAARAQDEDRIERYDVRHLLETLSQRAPTSGWFASPLELWSRGIRVAGMNGMPADSYELSGPFTVTALMRFALTAAGESATHVTVEEEEGNERWLKVNGPPRAQKIAVATLAELTRTASRRIEVELSVGSSEGVTEWYPVWGAGEVEQVLAAVKPLSTAKAFTYPGSSVVFESLTRRAYVADYDVEVAEKSRIADPLIDNVPSGRRVVVRVDPTASGDLTVTVTGQETSVDGPIRRVVLDFDPPANLELPVAWWGATTASARIPDGGALLIGNDVVPNALWIIRVRAAPELPPSDGAQVRFVPAGGVLLPPLRSPVPSFRAPSPSGAESRRVDEDPEEFDRDDTLRLRAEKLAELLQSLRPKEPPALPAAFAGSPLVALGGDAAFKAKGRDLVARVTTETLRTFALEVRAGAIPARRWPSPALEVGEELAKSLPTRAATAALAGDRVLLLAGRSHAYLKDYDVEIAKGASIADPFVGTFFTGLLLSATVIPAGADGCLFQGRLEIHEQLGLPESLPAGSRDVPFAELPRITSTSARLSATLPLNAWTVLHSAPLEGTGMQAVVMVRVRED